MQKICTIIRGLCWNMPSTNLEVRGRIHVPYVGNTSQKKTPHWVSIAKEYKELERSYPELKSLQPDSILPVRVNGGRVFPPNCISVPVGGSKMAN